MMLRNQHEYVGLDPTGLPQDETAPPLPKSRITTYIQIAVCLFVIRILYAFHKPLALLALILFAIVAAYQLHAQSQDAIQQHNAQLQAQSVAMHNNMERINREREESEAMVQEAARMMLEINRRHLEEFLITHPQSTYEQWIANLHPENVQEGSVIDHRFYVEDSDHRILWNQSIGPGQDLVPARSLKDVPNSV